MIIDGVVLLRHNFSLASSGSTLACGLWLNAAWPLVSGGHEGTRPAMGVR